MKRCPTCERTFANALSFCVEDATPLHATETLTLVDVLHEGARLHPRRAVALAASLCDALALAQGRAAATLMPVEIELDRDDKVRVTLALDAKRRRPGEQALDPAAPYAAPEVLAREPATPAAVVYNIGAILFEMLTGDVPFAGSCDAAIAVRKLLEEPPSVRVHSPDVSPELDALVRRALDRSPEARPPFPAAFADLLRALELPLNATSVAPAAMVHRPFSPPPPTPAGPTPLALPPPIAPVASAAMPARAASVASTPSRGGVWIAVGGVALVCAAVFTLSLSRAPRESARAPMAAPATAAPAPTIAAPAPPAPVVVATTPTPNSVRPPAPAGRQSVTAPGRGRPTVSHRALPPRPSSMRRPNSGAVGSSDDPTTREPNEGDNAAMRPSGSATGARSAPPEASDWGQGAESESVRKPPRVRPRPRPVRRVEPVAAEAAPQAVPTPTAAPVTAAPPAPGTNAAHADQERSESAREPVPGPAPMPDLQRDDAQQSEPEPDSDPLLIGLGLVAAVAGLVSMIVGVMLLRRRRGDAAANQVALPPAYAPPAYAPPAYAPPAYAPSAGGAPGYGPPLQTLPEPPRAEQPGPLWNPSLGPQTVPDAAWAATVQVAREGLQSAIWCTLCGTPSSPEARFCPNDGADLRSAGTTVDPHAKPAGPPAPEEMRAFTVGSYRCESRLGEGGMGVVYKARHAESGLVCAVKVLLTGHRADKGLVERFRREARLAASIIHPNSVRVYDSGEVGGQMFYLAMEFIDGRSLEDVIGATPLSLPRAADIVRQVCDGLGVAHAAGVVHRDLKPANVMVCARSDGGDAVKLVDFGIARDLRGGEHTLVGMVVGTPAYMAPEQARGEAGVGVQADVFAVAVMTWEMLSGRLPFDTEGNAIQQIVARGMLRGPAPPVTLLAPWVPPEIDAVLARATLPDVSTRTATVQAFVSEFLSAARGGLAA